jgi:hypothetical protein
VGRLKALSWYKSLLCRLGGSRTTMEVVGLYDEFASSLGYS